MHLKQCASGKEIFIVRNKNEILRQIPWKACAAISTCEATCQQSPFSIGLGWVWMGWRPQDYIIVTRTHGKHIAELLAYS